MVKMPRIAAKAQAFNIRLEMKKKDIVINIAGLPLAVRNRHDILQEPLFEKFLDKDERSSPFKYPINNISLFNGKEMSYAYSQLFALNGGMLLHATAVIKDKKAFIFLGVGGAGKSTIANLSKRYKVLGDDIIAVRKKGGHYYAFSTPWKQAPFIKPDRHKKGRIWAIFFIKKSNRISFKSLQPEHALMRMLSSHIHFLVYTKRPLTEKIFFTAADFTKRIPAYEMEFEKTRDFWRKLKKEISVARP